MPVLKIDASFNNPLCPPLEIPDYDLFHDTFTGEAGSAVAGIEDTPYTWVTGGTDVTFVRDGAGGAQLRKATAGNTVAAATVQLDRDDYAVEAQPIVTSVDQPRTFLEVRRIDQNNRIYLDIQTAAPRYWRLRKIITGAATTLSTRTDLAVSNGTGPMLRIEDRDGVITAYVGDEVLWSGDVPQLLTAPSKVGVGASFTAAAGGTTWDSFRAFIPGPWLV